MNDIRLFWIAKPVGSRNASTFWSQLVAHAIPTWSGRSLNVCTFSLGLWPFGCVYLITRPHPHCTCPCTITMHDHAYDQCCLPHNCSSWANSWIMYKDLEDYSEPSLIQTGLIQTLVHALIQMEICSLNIFSKFSCTNN